MPSIKSVLLAAASAATVAAKTQVNVYYGQNGDSDLADVCTSGVDIVTLAFVNVSPENSADGVYPGDNFGAHCWADTVPGTNLLTTCPSLTSGLQTCKDNGVKVLLSIGGEYAAASNYSISTDENAVEFAEVLWKTFGPYNSSWTGPRPFDVDGVHNSVDGFDLDFEFNFQNQLPYRTFAKALRSFFATDPDNTYLLTAAPQCAYFDPNWAMSDLVHSVAFDFINVQFYNNEACDALHDGFNFNDWISLLANTENADTPIYIGLPGSLDAASSGYLAPLQVIALVDQYGSSSHYGGITLWDAYLATINTGLGPDGKETNYLEVIVEINDGTLPVASSSSSVSPSASSTASSTTSSSSAPASVSASASSSTTPSSTSVPVYGNSSTPATAPSTAASASADAPAATSASADAPATVVVGAASGTPSGLITSTVQATVTSTIFSCAPTVTSCPYGKVTTVVIDLYTTVCPFSEAGKPAPPVTPSTVVVYSTTYATITSCAPTVTDCPARVATQVFPVYTTTVYVVVPTAVASVSASVPAPAAPAVPTVVAVYPYSNATSSFIKVASSTGLSSASAALPTTTPSSSVVTAGASRVPATAGMAALAVSVFAVLLL